MIYPNLFPRSEKYKKRMIIRDNQRKGKVAEDIVRMKYWMRGYEVERTGRGHDFRVRRRDPFTGRVIESKLIEVKSGRANLSKLQQKMKRKKSNYKVERVDPFFW
ncbi:MAG TPA: hypothetical protein ENI51_05425 [Candidatus Atribacteria bacterium]|nr:hypothetical protein [Candidatus Atribacteria bacterium]